MSEPLDALALYDALPPDERAAVEEALRRNPALAEAFRRWQSLRAAVRRDLAEALPNRALLVLYALSDEPPDLLDPAERARLDAERARLDAALAAHPGLVDAVRRIRADREAFEQAWAAHAVPVRANGHDPMLHRVAAPAADRPPVERVAARPLRRVSPVWRVAAVVAVVLFGAILAYVARRDAGFETIRAAQAQTVRLPDGSTAELAAGAVLQLTDGQADRQARLLGGSALFAVRHDEARPFTVETPNAVVTVLGTTFGVTVDGAATDVVLVSGAVALASKDHRAEDVRLAPGERSRVVALDAPTAPAPADLDAALGWTGDVFVRAEPLRAVAGRLSAAFGVPVEVDPALAGEVVSATRFERGAGAEEALEELALSLGAHVEARPEGGYRLAAGGE